MRIINLFLSRLLLLRFNEDDDFSAILKTIAIAALEEHDEVNSGEAQLQSRVVVKLHLIGSTLFSVLRKDDLLKVF